MTCRVSNRHAKWCEFVEERGGIRRGEESGGPVVQRRSPGERRTRQDRDGMTRRGSEHSLVQTRAREALSHVFFFFKSTSYYYLFSMSRLTLLAASVAPLPPAAGPVEDAAYVRSL